MKASAFHSIRIFGGEIGGLPIEARTIVDRHACATPLLRNFPPHFWDCFLACHINAPSHYNTNRMNMTSRTLATAKKRMK